VKPEKQNRRLERTGLAKPGKTRLLTGMGPGLARQAAASRVFGRVWKSCRDAPQVFKKISRDVSSLHILLKETGEMVTELALNEGLDSRMVKQLRYLILGCDEVLTGLRELLSRLKHLRSRSRFTLDRFLWSSGDVKDLRDRIVSYIIVLKQFCNTIQMWAINVLSWETADLQNRSSQARI